ncbi:MAG: hypothetical protein ISQ32_02365 [Rickettsiales bacterium]|nr:hypothetical protein [Rickettsiales bacterium]
MKFKYLNLVFFAFLLSNPALAVVERNKVFGDWLVSCKLEKASDKKGDCFLGTQYQDDMGGGAIIFTKYYLAFSHNELLLSDGVVLTVDDYSPIHSSMNTGISSFFKQIDRKALTAQMTKGKTLFVDITNQLKTKVSLSGYDDAYDFYLNSIN